MAKTTEALSIAQCVAKRRRQLERLEFLLDATARRLYSASSSGPSRSTQSHKTSTLYQFSEKAQTQTHRSYAQLLLDALRKEDEQQVGAQQLFASALPLEDFAKTMPRLLELRDEEDHVAQRTDLMWQVIRRSRATPKDADTTSDVLAQCELKWLSLVYGSAYLRDVILQTQELYDASQCTWSPFAKPQAVEGAIGGADGHNSVLLPKTISSIRPVVVVSHRLAWASLAAKTTHLGK